MDENSGVVDGMVCEMKVKRLDIRKIHVGSAQTSTIVVY